MWNCTPVFLYFLFLLYKFRDCTLQFPSDIKNLKNKLAIYKYLWLFLSLCLFRFFWVILCYSSLFPVVSKCLLVNFVCLFQLNAHMLNTYIYNLRLFVYFDVRYTTFSGNFVLFTQELIRFLQILWRGMCCQIKSVP
jgi:hypothetical protein